MELHKTNVMKNSEEMVSLNKSFEAEFEVQELEQRLETDPWVFIDILTQDLDADFCIGYEECGVKLKDCLDGYSGCSIYW
ncbi:MAG: hypothetical protein OSJ22_00665 [Rikenellaceae bacterium]|nr:hypothetical protein [Rikenellaceae bacterium]